MRSSSRFLNGFVFTIATFFLLFSSQSWSLQLQGLYTSACKREVGVIIDINGSRISLLRTDGKLITLPRYEVIFLVSYPLDRFPFTGQTQLGNSDLYEVKSEVDGKVQAFVKGWPIGFSEDKVSFLNKSGNEVMVDRKNIWGITKSTSGTQRFGSRRSRKTPRFGHPYRFRKCKIEGPKSQKVLYPQDVISNPIAIKSIFDALESGHDRLDRYHKEQQFYPVPLIYDNQTSLGVWQDVGGRHGSSSQRSSHLTPLLEDQYASDVFDYQHQILSGSAPNLDGGHEEVQTLASYRMKASYFHFSAMLDPNLILVGQNYEWVSGDLDALDDRANDVTILDLGLDFGYWSIRFFPSHVMSTAVRFDDVFVVEAMNMTGAGLKYQRKDWSFDFQLVSADESLDDDARLKLSLLRANFVFEMSPELRLDLSALLRQVDYQNPTANYLGESQVLAAYIYYNLSYRWTLGGYGAVESHENSFEQSLNSTEDSQQRIFPKAGVMTKFSF